MTLAAAPPGQKVLQHLPGHFLWKGGDAGLRDAMVGGEYGKPAAFSGGFESLLHLRDLRSQCFQPAQGAERLGLAVDGGLDRAEEGRCFSGSLLVFADREKTAFRHCRNSAVESRLADPANTSDFAARGASALPV